MPGFLHDFWAANLGPHAGAISALLTEPSLQPLKEYWVCVEFNKIYHESQSLLCHFLKCLLVKIQTTCVAPALPCMNRAALGLSRIAGVHPFVGQPSPCLRAASFISSSLLVFYSQAWVKYLRCVQYCARYSGGTVSHFSVSTKYWRVKGKRSLAQSGVPESWELCWLWWDPTPSGSVSPGQMTSRSETMQGEITSWV